MSTISTQVTAPVITVTAGDPSPEELAALLVVLAAASSGGNGDGEGRGETWNRRKGMISRGVVDERGNWRGSLRQI